MPFLTFGRYGTRILQDEIKHLILEKRTLRSGSPSSQQRVNYSMYFEKIILTF